MLRKGLKHNYNGLQDVGKQLLIWVFSKKRKFSTRYEKFDTNKTRFNNFLQKNHAEPKHINWEEVKLEPINKNFFTPKSSVLNRSPEEIQNFLTENNIKIEGDNCPAPIFTFEELQLPENLFHLLGKLNFKNPTPIQSLGWPIALSGRNMVGIGQTGSGKTLAFGLPGLLNIKNQRPLEKNEGPLMLVLAPTRELVQQTNNVLFPLARQLNFRTTCIFGGSSRNYQLNSILSGSEIYIATPGRLLDFLTEDVTNFKRCTYVVLDEADVMLNMGFIPQVEDILNQIRPDRQLLMWSATWSREIQGLAQNYLQSYILLKVGSTELYANPNIKQLFKICHGSEKKNVLCDILKEIVKEKEHKTLIFGATQRRVEEIGFYLKSMGFRCDIIHGGKKQNYRDKTLHAFRNSYINFLVATDVAARGLDISDISYVINYDSPNNIESYIHRIGRTARYNSRGTAISILAEDDEGIVPELIKVLKEAKHEIDPALEELSRSRKFNKRPNFSRFRRYKY